MTTTSYLGITHLTAGQASAEVTHNDGLDTIDAFLEANARPSNERFHFKEDFTGALIANSQNLAVSTNGTGASVSTTAVPGEDSHPGIATLSTGTTTTGYASIVTKAQDCIRLGGGIAHLRVVMRIPTLSDGTDTFTVFLGFGDSAAASGTPTDAVGARYTHGTNSGKFQLVGRANSTETAVDSGATAGAATWYRFDIYVAAGGASADVYLKTGAGASTLVGTISSNIPSGSGRETGIQISIVKSAGTTARTIDVDLVESTIVFTTER